MRNEVLTLQKISDINISDCFNIGNRSGYFVLEATRSAEEITLERIEARMAARWSGDPDRLVNDSRKAFEKLGWKPEFGDIETIVKHAWEWHKKSFS